MINGINYNVFKNFEYKKPANIQTSLITSPSLQSSLPAEGNKKGQILKAILPRALAILIPLGILAISRYTVPKEYRQLFKSLKKTDAKEYAQTAYTGLVKILNMQGIAPKKLTFEQFDTKTNDDIVTLMGHAFASNEIIFNKHSEKHFNYTKGNIIGLLRHELEHCKQSDFVLRNISSEEYTKAVLESIYGKLDYDIPFNKCMLKHSIKTVEKGYKNSLTAPKMKQTPETQRKTQKYIDAIKNYSTKTEKTYYENLLEQEAWSAQKKIEKMYRRYYFGPLSVLFDKSLNLDA